MQPQPAHQPASQSTNELTKEPTRKPTNQTHLRSQSSQPRPRCLPLIRGPTPVFRKTTTSQRCPVACRFSHVLKFFSVRMEASDVSRELAQTSLHCADKTKYAKISSENVSFRNSGKFQEPLPSLKVGFQGAGATKGKRKAVLGSIC